MILDQADRDDAVSSLLSKVSEVFAFMTEEEELAKITSMLAVYGKIARQTLECADFITHYSETKSACKFILPHDRTKAVCNLFVQGQDLVNTSSKTQMRLLRATATFSTVSCSNSEIKWPVTP
jgi:hypothetical protein